MDDNEWATGDSFGLKIPADGPALERGGAAFLTEAFRAAGVLETDNRVSTITRCEPCFGGGTGSKLLLSVNYTRPHPHLDTELFVKFSRNFEDSIRDSVRFMLAPEIRFAQLSACDDFPITVPKCYFADMHRESGTGLLITRRIPYGRDGIEQQHIKCMDYLLDNPLDHYRALVRALGRLAGSFKANRLSEKFYRAFPFDRQKAMAEDPLRYRDIKLTNRLARLGEFVRQYPRLFPENIRSPSFLADLIEDVPRFVDADRDIRHYLYDDPAMIALCHWNANIDNAWFWRDAQGRLQCGLMDWGAVGQMNVAKSIYGCISGADPWLWKHHLDDLLDTFISEFVAHGGPQLERRKLRRHVQLFAAMMGVAYLLDAPAILERQIPDPGSIQGPQDQRIVDNEDARIQLHMLTMFLEQWQTRTACHAA